MSSDEVDAFLTEAYEATKHLPPPSPDTPEEIAEREETMRLMWPLQLEAMAARDEQIDDTSTGNPDGVTAPEIPDPPGPPYWATDTLPARAWHWGWRAGYEAALLDRGATT